MQKLAILLDKLSSASQKDAIIKKEGEELIKVHLVTSAIAFMYEKIRTIVDYKEEHLLRKSAIFRILKRRFSESDDFYKIAENNNLNPKEIFKLMYKILINKEKGPKLSNFILTIGKERVINLLKTA